MPSRASDAPEYHVMDASGSALGFSCISSQEFVMLPPDFIPEIPTMVIAEVRLKRVTVELLASACCCTLWSQALSPAGCPSLSQTPS